MVEYMVMEWGDLLSVQNEPLIPFLDVRNLWYHSVHLISFLHTTVIESLLLRTQRIVDFPHNLHFKVDGDGRVRISRWVVLI